MSRQVQESTPLVDSPVSLSALMGPVAMKDCSHRNDRQVFSETKVGGVTMQMDPRTHVFESSTLTATKMTASPRPQLNAVIFHGLWGSTT